MNNKWINDRVLTSIEEELLENSKYLPVSKVLYKRLLVCRQKGKQVPPDLAYKIFFFLSTLRNRNLINQKEQEVLAGTVISFFGLSVGSNAIANWVMESRAKVVKMSDPDVISLSNLNRIRSTVENIGKTKVSVVRKELFGINPYIKVLATTKTGMSVCNSMLLRQPKTNIVVDSMDDITSKVHVRKVARKNGIPVIMATDVGDNVFIDVERYDVDKNLQIFNGRIKEEEIDKALSSKDLLAKRKVSVKIVGLRDNSERMIESLSMIGNKLKTWPQLGATAAIAGGLIASTAKKIVLGEKVASGRYVVSLDSLLVDDYNSSQRLAERQKLIKTLLSK